jgi:hypothetical protein
MYGEICQINLPFGERSPFAKKASHLVCTKKPRKYVGEIDS